MRISTMIFHLSNDSDVYRSCQKGDFSWLDQFGFPNDMSKGLTTPEYQKLVSDEFEQCRMNGLTFYLGYKKGTYPAHDRKPGSREIIRRFRAFIPESTDWYFGTRKIGDVFTPTGSQRSEIYATSFMAASFSNCVVPIQHILTAGTTHVAVGFVDLGILLDCQLVLGNDSHSDGVPSPLCFYGYDSSAYAVAKFSIVWEMITNGGSSVGPSEVVQVWFSAVWTKQATLAFLAAAKSVAQSGKHHAEVDVLLKHWERSKGVSLQHALKERLLSVREKSNASFMRQKRDRVAMLRYYFTGEFGLAGEAGCSGSITMFDCPQGTCPLQSGECVFNTMTVHDVVGSKFWDADAGYLHTAEREKINRATKLMDLARSGKVLVELHMGTIKLGAAARKVASHQPHSVSWSNCLDYFPPADFHELARECTRDSPGAIHMGYSMNWARYVFGSYIYDIATSSECMQLIEASSKEMRTSFGDKVFDLPFRMNPINTTCVNLARKCYKSWEYHFYKHSRARHQEATPVGVFNALSSSSSNTVSLIWSYE